MHNKMSSLAPCTLNAVELQTMTINCKHWTLAKEVCKALKYGKTAKTTDVAKHFCSLKNIAKLRILSVIQVMKMLKYNCKLAKILAEERLLHQGRRNT